VTVWRVGVCITHAACKLHTLARMLVVVRGVAIASKLMAYLLFCAHSLALWRGKELCALPARGHRTQDGSGPGGGTPRGAGEAWAVGTSGRVNHGREGRAAGPGLGAGRSQRSAERFRPPHVLSNHERTTLTIIHYWPPRGRARAKGVMCVDVCATVLRGTREAAPSTNPQPLRG
jgi:hypothetical protein